MSKIGFIGLGNIANAIIKGSFSAGIITPEDLVVFDIEKAKTKELVGLGATETENLKDLAGLVEILFLTVKPQIVFSVLEELKPHLANDVLIISPVAGVKMEKINLALGGNKKIIRVMPNTPLMYSAGATAIAVGEGVPENQVEFAEKIFGASGVTAILPEEQIDAVTGISGSSPAFFMRFAREIINEGVANGLTKENAEKLVLGTMLGTAKMMLQSDNTADELIKAVASPGGTTEAGLKTMDALDFDTSVSKIISAAIDRSKELSKN